MSNFATMDLGFQTVDRAFFTIDTRLAGYDEERGEIFFRELMQHAQQAVSGLIFGRSLSIHRTSVIQTTQGQIGGKNHAT